MAKKISICFFYVIFPLSNLFASNITVSGNVSGHWNVDTVTVVSNIMVPYAQTLTISPGCKILFEGFYRFTVIGQLIARGQPGNVINFERRDTAGFSGELYSAGGWDGLTVGYSTPSRSEFEFCVFKFMKGSSPVKLVNSNARFVNCQFLYNRASTILSYDRKEVDISQCVFSQNFSAYVVRLYNRPNDTIYFSNNTVIQNAGIGLYLVGASNSVEYVHNNIFWDNKGYGTTNAGTDEIFYEQYHYYGFDSSKLHLRNCIIKDGQKNRVFNNTCFSTYPLFIDTAKLNFGLRWDNYPVNDFSRSVGIDNGYYLCSPDEDNSRGDIGAISFYKADRKNHTWVRFKMDTTLGYLSNHTVRFTNLSNLATVPTTWFWDFGDGNTSIEKQPVHTYSQSGIFSVKLVAHDQDGHSDSLILADAITVLPGKRINPGAVTGVWEKQFNPYYIYGNIYVPDGKRLEIKAGVDVKFMGPYNLDVYGSLLAKGNLNDTIRFRANDTTGMGLYKMMNIGFPFADFQRHRGWGGLHFISNETDSDTCLIEFSQISDVRFGHNNGPGYRGALKLHKVKSAIIRHSVFNNNFITPKLYIDHHLDTAAYQYHNAGISGRNTSAIIENNHFENLYQEAPAAIYMIRADSIRVSGNSFKNIPIIAVALEGIKSYIFSDNTLDSLHVGVRLRDEDFGTDRFTLNEVTRNVFSNSGRGIMATDIYKVRFTKNIFKNNSSDIDVGMTIWGDSLYISNNLFYNNRVTGTSGNVGATCIKMQLIRTKTGVIANNTLVDNYGSFYQAIIYGDDSVRLYNNILWNKSGSELQGTHFTTSNFFADFTKSYNNNVKGGYAAGINNYNEFPQFVDSLNQNFKLKKESSSINRGFHDTSNLRLPNLDFFGNARVDPYLKKIDVGFFEYISQGPAKLTISNDTIRENLPMMVSIGSLTTSDPDLNDKHSYSFVNIPGIINNNDEFIISKDSLFSGTTFTILKNERTVSIRTTDDMGAFFDTSFIIKIKPNAITGISDLQDIQKIVSVYPIPFKDHLFIDPKNYRRGTWKIYSIKGNVIRTGLYQNKTRINLSGLSRGSYVLEIINNKKKFSILVVK